VLGVLAPKSDLDRLSYLDLDPRRLEDEFARDDLDLARFRRGGRRKADSEREKENQGLLIDRRPPLEFYDRTRSQSA
jgi:hypothetical protein